jgi:hypothetical protein
VRLTLKQQRCFPDDLIEIHPTSELWVKKKAPLSEKLPEMEVVRT